MNDRATGPIGVGQLLDRAVAGYVTTFLPIVAILAVEAVPDVIISAFTGDTSRLSASFARIGRPPVSDPATITRVLLLLLVGGMLALFARSAAVIYIDAVEGGRTLAIRDALRRALPRWMPQLGLAVIVTLLFGVAFIALIFAFVVVAIIAGIVAQAAHVPAAVATPLAVMFVIFVVIVTLVPSFAALLVYEISLVAIALDEGSPWRVFVANLVAVFDRRTWRSTLAVAASLFAISLLGAVFGLVLGALAIGVIHSVLLQGAVQAVVSVLLGGLVQWFVVLYARSVRERRSGDDLIRLAETSPA